MVEKESLDSAVLFCIKNTFQVLYVAAVKVRNILSSTDEIIFIILTVLEPTISKRNFGKEIYSSYSNMGNIHSSESYWGFKSFLSSRESPHGCPDIQLGKKVLTQ